ncbi:carboxylating nicotinate-nucleotide diphosphorylase [Proteinivorax hydrogeniformans]|uniref:Probable nicotinate-nucleotide pyrophosphorylase [carboxylating] n=1 Tax=Proteinivorax hydrogeniformans TaxID=1826727 RepID=A0AAU8HTQ2_9FIRM
MERILITEKLRRFLKEDLGHGDLTTNSLVPSDQLATGIIHAKESGVVSGIDVAEEVFAILDTQTKWEAEKQDGEKVKKGDIIARVYGRAGVVLKGERLALNLMQRMSGIATLTSRYVSQIKSDKCKVVDTRKTTPGLREFEKFAVKCGGGSNHRFALYDAVMIKDNHIKLAGSIKSAVKKARANIPHTAKIEVEVESKDQVIQAVESKADIIMLDNMSLMEMEEAVTIVGGKSITEASGGITLETIGDVSSTGVDYISVGALTHSVKALDISLDINFKKE